VEFRVRGTEVTCTGRPERVDADEVAMLLNVARRLRSDDT